MVVGQHPPGTGERKEPIVGRVFAIEDLRQSPTVGFIPR
jgi:hypothetical protein